MNSLTFLAEIPSVIVHDKCLEIRYDGTIWFEELMCGEEVPIEIVQLVS
jgi:hypothetical protein